MRKARAGCVSVAAAVAVATLTLGAETAGASTIDYNCGGNLCSIQPDGSGKAQLTTGGGYSSPSISRDGTRLAFVLHYHVVVADARAGNRGAPFASTAFAVLMRPDGGAVAEIEEAFSAVPFQICTYELDGRGRNCPYGTSSAGWAPDGNLLISDSAGAPNYNDVIFRCPAHGSSAGCNDVRAADMGNDLYDPAVSPDGSTLAVTVSGGLGGPVSGHIALYDYATGQFERNLTTGSTDERPAWSPDGKQIAFQRGRGIYVIGVGAPPGSERLLVGAGSGPTWGGPARSASAPPVARTLNTRITQTKVSRRGRRATFKFNATGARKAVGFQCELTREHHRARKLKFRRCRSPKTYVHLKPGSYVFKVRAVERGAKDRTPARHRFKINRGRRHRL